MKQILKSYKYRLYPTNSQIVLLNKTFGSTRFFWNSMVATFNSYDKELNPNPVFKTSTELRKDYSFLQEVSAAALQQKEIDFKEYKKQRFSKTRKKKLGNPSFKKKHDKQSYRLPNQKFKLIENKLQLEKIGKVKIVIDRVIPNDAKFMSVTISKTVSGEFYASVLVEQSIHNKPITGKSVGIDLGIKEFYTSSDNIVKSNPKFFRESQSKLRTAQKHLSRKQKGSNRRLKQKLKVAKIYQKIVRQRDYFLHNLTTELVNNYDTIVIEDLNVSGMVKNKKLAKSISDASFAKFRNQLTYKCDWYGKKLIVINRFEPTSKKCSGCGWVKQDLTLKDRVFVCESCGLHIDRDLNASLNIHSVGVNAELNQAQSDSKTGLPASCDEVLINSNDINCH